uniref:Uncharacterized protein n=1 Tax=Rhizophora mucronata TaxID=61149 RepID=A0A2P2PHL5_RHIMU
MCIYLMIRLHASYFFFS